MVQNIKLSRGAESPVYFAAVVEDPITGEFVEVPPVIIEAPFSEISFMHRQKKTYQQTLGGFVEFNWGDELDVISADGVTLAFFSDMGITSSLRETSLGYEDFRALLDFYKNNGDFYDPSGRVSAQGRVIMVHHGGSYRGYFESFDYAESDKTPHHLQVSFSFKVEKTVLSLNPTAPVVPGMSQTPTELEVSTWRGIPTPHELRNQLLANLETEFVTRGFKTNKKDEKIKGSNAFDPGRVAVDKDAMFKKSREDSAQRNAARRERSTDTAVFFGDGIITFNEGVDQAQHSSLNEV